MQLAGCYTLNRSSPHVNVASRLLSLSRLGSEIQHTGLYVGCHGVCAVRDRCICSRPLTSMRSACGAVTERYFTIWDRVNAHQRRSYVSLRGAHWQSRTTAQTRLHGHVVWSGVISRSERKIIYAARRARDRLRCWPPAASRAAFAANTTSDRPCRF